MGLPYSVVEQNNIRENDLFEVEIITETGIFREVILITMTDRSYRSDRNEYRFTLRLSDAPRSTEARVKFVRRIERLPSKLREKENYTKFYLPKLFPDGIMGKVHENEMLVFLGAHVPVFTPITINLMEFIHYFGCYYADGTKKGWAWRISASTPEQAIYYMEKYNELVFGNQLTFRLSYSKKPSDMRKKEQLKKDLVEYWEKNTKVKLKDTKIKIRETKHDNIRKWNRYGTFDIHDNRNLVMEVHLRIMTSVTKYLANECLNDDEVWDFLFGILEGDGCVGGGKGRFSVCFATHSTDKIIEKLLIRLGIQYHTDKSRVKNNVPAGITVKFGLFEILLNLKRISDSLFIYYPKRRHIFIKRLLKQSTTEYLLKRKETISTFARSFLIANMLDTEETYHLLDILEREINNTNI